MLTSMDRPTTCRTSTNRRVLSVAVILAISAAAALAATPANLSLTVAGAGTFISRYPVQACSIFSPEFTNQTSWKGPSSCVNTITIWAFNNGGDTDGTPVTVTNVFPVGSSKAGTVLAVNGFCAFGAGNCGSITVAAGGWTCSVTQGSVSCTRTDVLPAGRTYPPIVIKVLIEDAFDPHLTEFDDAATVSGGGSASASKFTDFSDAISFGGPPQGYVEVVVHTVPEGLTLSVDGVDVSTPHAYSWQIGSIHTILTEDPAGNLLNPGFTAVASNFGGLVTNLFVPPPPPFILLITAPDYQVSTGPLRDQFTAIFTKP
jgi:hypothetical protein